MAKRRALLNKIKSSEEVCDEDWEPDVLDIAKFVKGQLQIGCKTNNNEEEDDMVEGKKKPEQTGITMEQLDRILEGYRRKQRQQQVQDSSETDEVTPPLRTEIEE